MVTATEKESKGKKGSAQLGAIDSGQVYPLPVFMGLSGLSLWAMRQARRNGLPLKTVGRRKFVCGSDWLRYLEQLEG